MEKSPENLHVILFQPEIPNNTGNIGRVCVATGCHLHLIGPLGFDISEKSVRRAGLDYWQYLTVHTYEDYSAFLAADTGIQRIHYLSTKAKQVYTEALLQKGDGVMFGPETRGLPQEILEANAAQCYLLPMIGPTRSLNLANTVAVVAYEGLRQKGES